MNQAGRNVERTYKRSQQGMVMVLNEVFKMRKMRTEFEGEWEGKKSSYRNSKMRGALMLVFNKNNKKFVSDLK